MATDVLAWQVEASTAHAFQQRLLLNPAAMTCAVPASSWTGIWMVTLSELLEADDAWVFVALICFSVTRMILRRTAIWPSSTSRPFASLLLLLIEQVARHERWRLISWLADHFIFLLILLQWREALRVLIRAIL
jgi:hypothetical protein